MSKISTATFPGASGQKYNFNAYTLDTEFKEIGAVYVFSKRKKDGEGYTHEILYVGETGELDTRMKKHRAKGGKLECALPLGCNCVCVHSDSGDDSRLDKESDLVEEYDPPCNE